MLASPLAISFGLLRNGSEGETAFRGEKKNQYLPISLSLVKPCVRGGMDGYDWLWVVWEVGLRMRIVHCSVHTMINHKPAECQANQQCPPPIHVTPYFFITLRFNHHNNSLGALEHF